MSELNLLSNPNSKTIKLADDKEYILPPITLNILANIEDEFDCGITEISSKYGNRLASMLKKFLYVLLKPNYPDMTLDAVGNLVTLDKLGEITESFKNYTTIKV